MINIGDFAAKLREIVGYPRELIDRLEEQQAAIDAAVAEGASGRWDSLVTDADRRAATLITAFLKESKERDLPPVRETHAFEAIKLCSPIEIGAIVAAIVSMMCSPAWAAALGLSGMRPAHGCLGYGMDERQLLDVLLLRKCELTHTHHRVILMNLAISRRGLGGDDDKLGRLVVEHAMAHPGVNDVEMRDLLEAVGGPDSLTDLAVRLRAPLGIVLPERFRVGDISSDQRRLLEEWIAQWTAIYGEIGEPQSQPNLIDAFVSEFIAGHAEAFRRYNGTPPYGVAMHHEWLLETQLARNMTQALTPKEHNGRTFDRDWLAERANAYATWKALAPEARWWVVIANDQAEDAPPPILRETFGSAESLFERLTQVPSVKPSAKWLRAMAALRAGGEGDAVRDAVSSFLDGLAASDQEARNVRWSRAVQYRIFAETVLPHIETYRTPRLAVLRGMCMEFYRTFSDGTTSFAGGGEASSLTDEATRCARGAVWALTLWPDDTSVALIAQTAQRLLARAASGYRSLAAANSCFLALSEIGTPAAIMALDRIKRNTRDGSIAKQLDKAKAHAADKAGLTISELEELSTPTHDLDTAGRLELPVVEGAALLAVDGTSAVALTWRTPDGKVTKSLPAAMQAAKDDVKAAKAKAKAIEADLAILPWRIQRLWLEERRWAPEAWRQRYVEHPLAGPISRRLIWDARIGQTRVAGIWRDGALVGLGGHPVSLDEATITLWHPVTADVPEVLAWRGRLADLGVTQPFKQAHREIYVLTDAERRTNAYSNRFAGHIVKQQQMIALARLSGWAMGVHTWFDGDSGKSPCRIALPHAGLIAEYWLEGAGGPDDQTPNGSRLYLSTDQLRFVRPTDMASATKSLATRWRDVDGLTTPLEQVPPLLLSEIMRHCDLFVGVTSIANDPNWIDAGATVRDHRWRQQADAYWHDRSFGEIGVSGETRRDLLAALLPRLALGKVSRIEGSFMRVEGKLRAYKIHLGSGNIQMKPNDQYLCIVPAPGAALKDKPIALPFEGDNLLSIILSKAALLAADDKITDPMILSQIRR